MAERNELAVFGRLVAGLFAKFTHCNLFHCFCWPAGVDALGYSVVDLTGGHFPDRLPDRDAVLANKNTSTVSCHRRDNHGHVAVHNPPRARLAARSRSDLIRYE